MAAILARTTVLYELDRKFLVSKMVFGCSYLTTLGGKFFLFILLSGAATQNCTIDWVEYRLHFENDRDFESTEFARVLLPFIQRCGQYNLNEACSRLDSQAYFICVLENNSRKHFESDTYSTNSLVLFIRGSIIVLGNRYNHWFLRTLGYLLRHPNWSQEFRCLWCWNLATVIEERREQPIRSSDLCLLRKPP